MGAKLEYMDRHCICTSIVSLANPWLDFLHGQEAESVAMELNDELQVGVSVCVSLYFTLFLSLSFPITLPLPPRLSLSLAYTCTYLFLLIISSHWLWLCMVGCYHDEGHLREVGRPSVRVRDSARAQPPRVPPRGTAALEAETYQRYSGRAGSVVLTHV